MHVSPCPASDQNLIMITKILVYVPEKGKGKTFPSI